MREGALCEDAYIFCADAVTTLQSGQSASEPQLIRSICTFASAFRRTLSG